MGAGTSAEQVADKPKEEQAEQSNDLGQQQQDDQAMQVDAAADVKLLHKNGNIAIVNGTAEGEETVEVIIQAEDLNGYQEEEVAKGVEQTEPAKVALNGEQEENMEVALSDTIPKENAKEDVQTEISEINDTTPVSEEKQSPEQPNENQSSEVGFKKVFKFVGFKFTVKKDKTEKSEPVQLLTVKKDETDINGSTSQEEQIDAEANTQTQQETKEVVQKVESPDEAPQAIESPVEVPEEVHEKDELTETHKKKEEAEVEKDKKSPESPTNTVVTETSSPFKRFFTQGWAGLRKKTSFRKSKEEDPQEVEKHIKCEEQEKNEPPEAVKEEEEAAKEIDLTIPGDSSKSENEEPKSSNEEDSQICPEEAKTEKVPSDQPEDQKSEETVKADEGIAAQVTGDKESVPEIVTAALIVSSGLTAEIDNLEIKPENQITDVICPPSVEVTNESKPEVVPDTEVPASEQSELHSSIESAELEKIQGITTEAELLSSQEKVKTQGSPLKKLFSSSGLRKLSGKKSKGKKDDDGKADVTAEPTAASSESPEAAEGDGGDSSASSPDESVETSPTEKPVEEDPQEADLEGEGATSDGERKKDGITPWASFKKLVTPKRRPKRPSESDKEDEVEKVKTSTMSSTDSGGSVENQEEAKETNEEQKLEKSTEENKKKAESSVSWDALICVGSSKKRARKTSDSDEEEIQKSQEESKKNDGEIVQVQPKEPESESPITSSQEQQVQDSPSPDQASSPTEGDGVSTWQSFKRLVTPRRKSRTKAEEKSEETAVVSNPEQSTSEGEGGKEESWVSFKKLIPGRKKKRSDARQDQAPPNADQLVHESAEDDSDEPAVVPLAEFDAAELEKLNAQRSIIVSSEQKESLEKLSDELVHAVTVTLIEGERAVTSLEERAPSWISARVTETIEHATEVEEITEKIKTEITVQETVVFSNVSQVMAETQSTLLNDVELTSEALTALEEAIETSCAEETTEMLSAVSQLGESVMSTEQPTPVPEDDASVQTLQEQKRLTDNILHAVAESAKLSFDVLNSENVNVSQNIEDDVQATTIELRATTLTEGFFAKPLEEEKPVSTVEEEHIEKVIITVTEKVTEHIPTSIVENVQVKSEEKVSESPVEQIDTADKDEFLSEKLSESVYVSSYDQDTVALEKSVEDLSEVIKETLHSGEAKVVVEEQTAVFEPVYNYFSQEIAEPLKGEQTEGSVFISVLEKESKIDVPTADDAISFENQVHADKSIPISLDLHSEHVIVPTDVQAEISVPVSSEVASTENIIVTSELQEETIVSHVKQIEESVPLSADLEPKDVVPMSLEIESNVQNDESVMVTTEVPAKAGAHMTGQVENEKTLTVELQAEESNLATETQAEEDAPVPLVQAKEGAVMLPEVQSEEGTPVFEVKAEESSTVPPETQAGECVLVLLEVQAKESSPVALELQVLAELKAEESDVLFEVQTEESAPVLADVTAHESDALSHEEQTEVSAPLLPEAQVEDAAPVLSEDEVKAAVPVPSEVQVEETVPVVSKVQTEDNAAVLPEVEVEEASSVPSEVQAEEVASVSSEVQTEEAAQVLSEVHTEEIASVLPDVKPEEIAPVSTEAQAAGDITETAEVQAEESVPVLTKPHAKGVPVSSEVKADEGTSVLTELQPAEDEKVTDEVQTVLNKEHTGEDAAVAIEVQAEQCAPELPGENLTLLPEVQVEEGGPVSDEFKAQECVSDSKEEQGECTSLSSDVKFEETTPIFSEEKPERDYAVSTQPQVKEGTHASVGGQAKEAISLSDKVDIEDSVPELVKESVEEVALDEIQVEKTVSVSAEEQVNVDVPDAQTEDKVCVVAEVQTELPVSTRGQNEEGVTTSAEEKIENVVSDQLQTQECVSDVHTEKSEPMEACKGESEPLNNVVSQVSLFEEVAEVKEEINTPDIPEFEPSEASKASEPSTAAAVEETKLAETAVPNETSPDCIQLIKEPNIILQSEDHADKPEELQTLVASVSQKAAAIVDAAIEAATNCFVVDASSQDETTEDTTLTEEKHQTEETVVETSNPKSSSTTTVNLTVETTVDKVTEIIDNECVSTERQRPEDEFVCQVQEAVHEPTIILSSSAQTKGNETDGENKPTIQEQVILPPIDLVDHKSTEITPNVQEESKLSTISIQEDIHKTFIHTDSSTTDTQEKEQPVES